MNYQVAVNGRSLRTAHNDSRPDDLMNATGEFSQISKQTIVRNICAMPMRNRKITMTAKSLQTLKEKILSRERKQYHGQKAANLI